MKRLRICARHCIDTGGLASFYRYKVSRGQGERGNSLPVLLLLHGTARKCLHHMSTTQNDKLLVIWVEAVIAVELPILLE
jgi:hypothetical protein